MTDVQRQKSNARAGAMATRKLAHQNYSGTSATDNLLALLKPHLGEPISAYMPIRTEIDPMLAMETLAKSGPVAVPVIVGDGQPLEFHQWHPDSKMKNGPFGAQIPVGGNLITPAVVILPLLAFDRWGYRLGYGGGYYDRSLDQLRANGPILAIGFAYSAQEIPLVPTEGTDQRLDALVTDEYSLVFSEPAG